MIAQLDLSTALDHVPALLQGTLVVLLLMGLALWLLGRRLARPAVAVGGLLVGGLGAMAIAQNFDAGRLLLPIVIGGAVVGCLLAALLFRVWMGASCAAILALAVPLLWASWQGSPPPNDQTLDLSHAPPVKADHKTWQWIQNVVQHEQDVALRWWKDLDPPLRRNLLLVAGIAAAAGLVGGLIWPMMAAALQSALVGATIMTFACASLIRLNWPDAADKLPDSTRSTLLLLGLITAAGILLQWTLWRRSTDNGS